MRKLYKKPASLRETMLALATDICGCYCGCHEVCNCPTYPTHQIAYDQSDDGHTMSVSSVEGSNRSFG